MQKNFVVLQLRYVTQLQDLATAIFCSQLHYWYSPKKNGKSKLQILREGHLWVAKSIPEWCNECGLSEKQVRRAMDVLAKTGVIVKEVYMFGQQSITHIRVAKKLSGDILKKGEFLTDGIIECPPGHPCPTGHPPLPSKAPPLPSGAPPLKILGKTGIKQEDQTLTKSKLVQGVGTEQNSKLSPTSITHLVHTEITCNSLQHQNKQVLFTSGKVKVMKGKSLNSASEILNNLKKQKGKIVVVKSSIQEMIQVWREVVPKHNENVKFVATFTMQQKGQFKQFEKKCGAYTISVLRHVLQYWIGYSKYVAEQQGLKVTPDSPALGFLLKYAQEAVNFYLAECATEKKPKVQLIAPKEIPKVQVGSKETATLDDILALKPKK